MHYLPLTALTIGFLAGHGFGISIDLAPVIIMIVAIYALIGANILDAARTERRNEERSSASPASRLSPTAR